MTNEHQIVVSVENTAYMAWQAKLFYFSCVTRLNHSPIFFVHEADPEWHPDFYELAKAGGRVRRAPSYRANAHGEVYQPRNTAGTLLHAAALLAGREEFIVLCDPDMIFARRPEFPATLSGDRYAYKSYDQEAIRVAGRSLGIGAQALAELTSEACFGVPYVIPAACARPLAEGWLEAVDAFPPRQWEDIMYAFGLAAARLGLPVAPSRLTDTNYGPHAPLDAPVIHYCYGDAEWNKRHYFRKEKAQSVWEPPAAAAPRGTILGEIFAQIREAREFYRGSLFP